MSNKNPPNQRLEKQETGCFCARLRYSLLAIWIFCMARVSASDQLASSFINACSVHSDKTELNGTQRKYLRAFQFICVVLYTPLNRASRIESCDSIFAHHYYCCCCCSLRYTRSRVSSLALSDAASLSQFSAAEWRLLQLRDVITCVTSSVTTTAWLSVYWSWRWQKVSFTTTARFQLVSHCSVATDEWWLSTKNDIGAAQRYARWTNGTNLLVESRNRRACSEMKSGKPPSGQIRNGARL